MQKAIIVVAAALLLPLPVQAAQQHLDIIQAQCGIQLQKSPAVCSCLARNASTQLNDNQQAFMAAQVTNNGSEIVRLQPMLSLPQLTAIGQFMSTGLAACGG